MKAIHIAYLFATATALLCGCVRSDKNDIENKHTVNVAFAAKSDHIGGDVRAIIDDGYESGRFTGAWEAGDQIAVTNTIGGLTERVSLTFDADTKLFHGTMSAGRGAHTYRAVYPYDPDGKIAFGREREQRGNAFNSVYDAMLSAPVSVADAEAGVDDGGRQLTFDFTHLTSIVAVRFATADGSVANEKVKAIILSSDNAPLSAAYLDIDTDASAATLGTDNRSRHIAALYDDASAPSAADARAFFNVAAGDYGKLTIDIVTEGHRASVVADRTGKALEAGKLYYTSNTVSAWSAITAPTAVWVGNESFAPMKIEADMTGKCTLEIDVPAGVSAMHIVIDSPVLTDAVLRDVGLAADMDIIDNASYAAALGGMGLTTGDALVNSRSIHFDVGGLVPLIAMIAGGTTGDNKFTVLVTDYAGNTLSKTMTFTLSPASPIAYNNDADLWANTATVSVKGFVAGDIVEYKSTTDAVWHTTAQLSDSKFGIEPEYNTVPADGKRLRYLEAVAGTGVWSGGTYDVRLRSGDDVKATATFSVGGTPDTLPNAGMDYWSDFTVAGKLVGGTVSYPNKAGDDKFWVSGNNNMTKSLCVKDAAVSGFNGEGCAKLAGTSSFGVFATGNLFTGDMSFDTSSIGKGYAQFGQKYDYSARPSALRLRINATIGTMNYVGNSDPEKDVTHIKGTTRDYARILFCITDWSARHTVQSGLSLDTATFWNPAQQSELAEGQIIGYGMYDITEDTAGWVELTIPVRWYDTDARPANYSLVISAASSANGDYMTGSTSSVLYIEDFAWVY